MKYVAFVVRLQKHTKANIVIVVLKCSFWFWSCFKFSTIQNCYVCLLVCFLDFFSCLFYFARCNYSKNCIWSWNLNIIVKVLVVVSSTNCFITHTSTNLIILSFHCPLFVKINSEFISQIMNNKFPINQWQTFYDYINSKFFFWNFR